MTMTAAKYSTGSTVCVRCDDSEGGVSDRISNVGHSVSRIDTAHHNDPRHPPGRRGRCCRALLPLLDTTLVTLAGES